jgi:CheY-like chemotaxis protein
MQREVGTEKLSSLRILIAEPEPDIQKLYSSFLSGWTFEIVDFVETGEKCIERLFARVGQYDIIIIDSHLKGFGAIECIRKIQLTIPNQRLLVTSTSATTFRQEAKRAGVDMNGIKILEKPFSFTQFLSLMPSKIPRTSKVGIHDHVLAIYDTLEEEFEEAIIFLKDAGSKGEAALFVVRSDYDIDTLKNRMQSEDLEVDSLIADGSLIVMHNEDWYIPDSNSIDKHRIIEQWNKLVGRCTAKGKKGLRAFCMMDCFFEHGFIEQVIDYEHTLPVKFEMPFVPICAYRKQDVNMLSEDQKRRLVVCHSHVWTSSSHDDAFQ